MYYDIYHINQYLINHVIIFILLLKSLKSFRSQFCKVRYFGPTFLFVEILISGSLQNVIKHSYKARVVRYNVNTTWVSMQNWSDLIQSYKICLNMVRLTHQVFDSFSKEAGGRVMPLHTEQQQTGGRGKYTQEGQLDMVGYYCCQFLIGEDSAIARAREEDIIFAIIPLNITSAGVTSKSKATSQAQNQNINNSIVNKL